MPDIKDWEAVTPTTDDEWVKIFNEVNAPKQELPKGYIPGIPSIPDTNLTPGYNPIGWSGLDEEQQAFMRDLSWAADTSGGINTSTGRQNVNDLAGFLTTPTGQDWWGTLSQNDKLTLSDVFTPKGAQTQSDNIYWQLPAVNEIGLGMQETDLLRQYQEAERTGARPEVLNALQSQLMEAYTQKAQLGGREWDYMTNMQSPPKAGAGATSGGAGRVSGGGGSYGPLSSQDLYFQSMPKFGSYNQNEYNRTNFPTASSQFQQYIGEQTRANKTPIDFEQWIKKYPWQEEYNRAPPSVTGTGTKPYSPYTRWL